MLKTGHVFENRYRVVGQMTSGGFADIFVGCDLRLGNKPVIIKMLRRDFAEDRERIQMFLDEINLTTRLDHENIVRVYDILKSEEFTYLQILELIEGVDLKQMISDSRQKNLKIPYDLVAYIIAKVCLALDYAHDKKDTATGGPLNIVHRDISPSNILLSYDGKAKLTDFGIAFAHLHQRQSTRMGELKGKISYMSTEQVKGFKVDRRSDLYSLGIVMYETLVGKRLFDGDSDIEVLQKVAEGNVNLQPLETLEIPEPLRWVLLKSLEKKITARYQTAFEMYTDLQKYLSSQDEYALRSKLRDFLSEFKRETRLSQLLGILKGEVQEEPLLDLTLPPEKEEEGKEEEERTIYDLIRLQEGHGKKIWAGIGLSFFIAALAFAGIDTFSLRMTPIGQAIYNLLFPPALVIESIPKGARVLLDGQPRKGTTPLPLSKIKAGSYGVELELEGYKSVKRTISVTEKGEDSKGPQTEIFSFEVPLTIRSNPPGAKVYFQENREPHPELTPISLSHPLEPVPLKVRLELPGFQEIEGVLNLENPSNLNERFIRLDVKKDEAGIFQYTFTGHFYAEVRVTSMPERASVSVIHDRESSDPLPTPVTLILLAGENLLKAEMGGWIPWEEKILIENGEPRNVRALLRKQVSFKTTESGMEKAGISFGIFSSGEKFSTGITPLLDTLEIGQYEIRFDVPQGYERIKPITINIPGDSLVTANLIQARPILKVTVIDANTKGLIPGAVIWLRFQETEDWKTYKANDGTYESRISEGDFYIAASAPDAGYKLGPYEKKVMEGSGLEVTLYLSKGDKPPPPPPPPPGSFVQVPDLIGKQSDQAKYRLQKDGLELKIVYTVKKEIKKYEVIYSQEPKAGTKVKKGTTITVYINRKK